MMRIILIADDQNSTRDIQNRLQRASYDVTTMTVTADEVITRADELRPDVILMDVGLKGEMDGVEVAQQIKSLHDIPIIFIAANADEATMRRAIAAEPDGFLIMPLDELELRAAIEIAIHRHGAEAKARESDRRIRELTESLSEVIFETDMAGNITFVNQAGLKEFGYTKEQVEGGMTLYDFIPPDKQEEIRESIAQAVIDEPSEWTEVPGLRRDGSIFPVLVRASLIVREGVRAGLRGVALNVTEQKRAEQQREDSERQLSELTDSLPEIVFETDVGGTFTFLNPMGLDSLGYTKADLKKQLTIEDLIIPADRARARENFRKRLGGTAAVWAEYTAQRKNGSAFPLSIRTTAVIRDGVVVGARGIAVDITERKRAEERAREHTYTREILNRIMIEGNRAASVESFAETVTNLTLELMHFDAGTIHLGDDDARCANLRYATGIPDTVSKVIREIPLDEPPYVGFLVEPKPLFLEGHNVSRVPHVAELGLKSLAVVPLYHYDAVVGALNVGSFKRHNFSQSEKELLIAIGNEAGMVIAKLHADEALKESEKRIRDVTETLPVVVYETDETGRFTFVNATVSDMFGYAKEEIEAGMSIFQMITPADKKRARTVFRRRMRGEGAGRIEYTGLRKDGGMFPILIRAVQMRRDGAVIGVRGVIVDFTEQKQTQQSLARESAINSAIARLFMPLISQTSTLEDIALAILDEAKHLTESEAGFVGLIDPANRDMIGFGLSQMMPGECAIHEEKRQIRFPIGPDGSYPALWGRALNTKKGFCTNAPATHPASRGTPDGHTPLAQLLAVPALVGDHVEGEIMLANPARDYTERDLMAVERLADVYALAVIRTKAEDAIKSALGERETLLKEIHHRVKNNMQVISSFLNLQAAQAKEPETVDMLNESQSRIRSMALIHEQLYRSSSLADIDFAEYVKSLTNALLRMYNVAEGEIAINTDIENVQLGVDTAIPCALIVNELVSNCLKHAFTDRETGEVAIAIHRINRTYELTVADNGRGFRQDLDFRETNTLGLQLVTALVNQLEGTITLDRTKGTTFIITFTPAGAPVARSKGK